MSGRLLVKNNPFRQNEIICTLIWPVIKLQGRKNTLIQSTES